MTFLLPALQTENITDTSYVPQLFVGSATIGCGPSQTERKWAISSEAYLLVRLANLLRSAHLRAKPKDPMPDNQRQHYVPKFYLRLFGSNDGASLDVFNIERSVTIRSASLKKQASRPWFYGKELRLEKFFQFFEGKAAHVITRIAKERALPNRFSEDHHILMMHIALQYGRTKAAQDVMNEQADKFARALLAHHIEDPELLAALPSVTITLTNAIQDSVRHSISTAPLFFDLRYKLIENRSSTAFITSDAPVVLHNDWLHGLDRNTGVATSGLQVLLPLGPRLSIILYDGSIYKVGRDLSNTVKVTSAAHVQAINDLQWESADCNIYVSGETKDGELEAEAPRNAHLRKQQRVRVEERVLQENDDRKEIALNLGKLPSVVDLDLPFISLLRPRLASIKGSEVPPVRSIEIVELVKDARKRMDDGQLSIPEFLGVTGAGIVMSLRETRK